MDPVALKIRDLDVLDPEGGAQRLGALWKTRPVVLVFTRHFG